MFTLFAETASNAVRDYDVPWFMYVAIVGVLVGYAIIEAFHSRKDHVIKFKEAMRWTIFYVVTALLFSIPIFLFINKQAGFEYLAALAVEKALSLDNLFVFSIIFTTFRVNKIYQRRILNYGIVGAIFFRLLFILTGVALLKRFEWISIFFGLILFHAAWTTLKEARAGNVKDKEEISSGRLWRAMQRVLPIYPHFVGHQLTTVVKGKRMLTMMAAIIILIELTDIVFAVDSVPAVLAISPDKFIAYASNIFAILGLRALFFVYQSVEGKFWALNWALAAVLGWIGFKMIAAPLGLHVPITISLGVLAVLLSGGVVVSLLYPKDPPTLNS